MNPYVTLATIALRVRTAKAHSDPCFLPIHFLSQTKKERKNGVYLRLRKMTAAAIITTIMATAAIPTYMYASMPPFGCGAVVAEDVGVDVAVGVSTAVCVGAGDTTD